MADITMTTEEMVEAFTEWDRRWREDPESFKNIAVELLEEDSESYGAEAAPYFLAVLEDNRRAAAKTEADRTLDLPGE